MLKRRTTRMHQVEVIMGGKLAIIVLFSLLNTISAKDLSLETFKNKWSGSFAKENSSRDGEVYRAHIQGSDFPSYIEKTFSPEISFREKFLKVVFKVSDLSKLSGIELRLSSEESGYENFYAVPIPLFTDKDFNTIQSDAWVTYTFTMGEARVHGEPDIDNIVRL
ncbi:MAG: hypothetical protein NXH75_13705, partial [Halobacteriovoraceae bacterium]|nr:hypothetical protein [Halobacteriovoraceae bacterium]